MNRLKNNSIGTRLLRARTLHVVLLAFLPLVIAGIVSCGSKQPSRPDVLFIIEDALRAESLPFHGYSRPTAPFMTQLASEGAVFENFNCNALWTRSSVPAILSGKVIHSHGLTLGDLTMNTENVDRLPETQITMLESAQKLGYQTGGFFVPGWYSADFGFDQGFDEKITSEEYKRFWEMRANEPPSESKGFDLRITDEYITKRAQEFIDKAVKGRNRKPFFAYLHVNGPHGPYDTPEPYATKFCNPEILKAMRQKFPDTYQIELANLAREDADGSIREYMTSQYDSAILYSDDVLKRLVTAVQAKSRNLLVIITADHGQALHERKFEYRHGTNNLPFHELVHIPFVMHWPGKIKPQRVAVRAQSADILPTVLSALGGRPEQRVDGADLMPLLDPQNWKGGPPADDRLMVMEGDENYFTVAVTEGDDKLLQVFPSTENSFWLGNRIATGFEGLFDLARDEGERFDLSFAKPAAATRLRNRADRECLLPWYGYHLVITAGSGEGLTRFEPEIQADSDIDRVSVRYHNDELPFDKAAALAQAYPVTEVLGRPGLIPGNTNGVLYGAGSTGRLLRLNREPVDLAVSTPVDTVTRRELYLFGGWFRCQEGKGMPRLEILNARGGNVYGAVEPATLSPEGAYVWGYALLGEGLPRFQLSLTCANPEGAVFEMKDLFVCPAPVSFSGFKREGEKITASFPLASGRTHLRFLTMEDLKSVNLTLNLRDAAGTVNAMPLRVWKAGEGFAPFSQSSIATTDIQNAYVDHADWPNLEFSEPGTAYFYSTVGGLKEMGSMSRETRETLESLGYLQSKRK